MSWSSRVATLVVGALLFTPMHIFLTGNSSTKDLSSGSIASEGKSTWQLMKEIRSKVEEADKYGKTPATDDSQHPSSTEFAKQTGKQKSSEASSSGIFKLMLPFWAIDDDYTDELKKLSSGGQDLPDGFDETDDSATKSSDPLENGTMLAISGILLFVMIAVLAFDIGEKTPWPAIVLSRANLFGTSSNKEKSRSRSKPSRSKGGRSWSRAETPAPNSHRVEQYLKSKTSRKEDSPSKSTATSRRVSLGFNKTVRRHSKPAAYDQYAAESDDSAATAVDVVTEQDDRRSRSAAPSSLSPSPQRSMRSGRFSCRSAAASVKARKSGVWGGSSTSPSPSPARSPAKSSRHEERVTPKRQQDFSRKSKNPVSANLHPGTSGVYQVVRESQQRRGSVAPNDRSIHTYTNPLPPHQHHRSVSSNVGDNVVGGSSCSFAVEANPQGYLLQGGRGSNKEQGTSSINKPSAGSRCDQPENQQTVSNKPPPFLNYVLQALCQCPILKYFFVDGLSQFYFDEGERLASPLTQLFANFIRNVWHPPPNTKINTDTLQHFWATNAVNMFNVDSPALEHYLSSLFLALYTDIRRVAKTRSHHHQLGHHQQQQHLSDDQVTRIGRLIGSSILERRKIEVSVTDENGIQVPHELLAHSALTFPGVTFSSSGKSDGDGRDGTNQDLASLLNSLCTSSSGTRLKIENESMQIPCLLNFHYPGHYFTNFPEKLYIKKDVKAAGVDHAGDDDGTEHQQRHPHHRPVSSNGDLFSLYAVVFQLRDQEVYSVAIKHAQRGGWFYTEGASVARCKACPSQEPPRSQGGSCPKPILLLYTAENWNEDLPLFNASDSFENKRRMATAVHRCPEEAAWSSSRRGSKAPSSRASPHKQQHFQDVHYEPPRSSFTPGPARYSPARHQA